MFGSHFGYLLFSGLAELVPLFVLSRFRAFESFPSSGSCEMMTKDGRETEGLDLGCVHTVPPFQ